MNYFGIQNKARNRRLTGFGGFTILELMVSMALGALVLIGVLSAHFFIMKTYEGHKEYTTVHTRMRSTMALSAVDFQAAGRSGLQPGNPNVTGVTDIRRYDMAQTYLAQAPNVNGNQALTYTTIVNDWDGNGYIDSQDLPFSIVMYRLVDDEIDGRPDLIRVTNDQVNAPCSVVLARSVDGFGIAFAVDNNRDGILDQYNVNPGPTAAPTMFDNAGNPTATMWCVDTNNDNFLDAHLDSNLDGVIDELDDPGQDGQIDVVALGTLVPLTRIRQIKMWVMVRATLPERGYTDWHINPAGRRGYVVGDQVVWPAFGDEFRRRVVTVGITLRNHEGNLQL